MNKNLWMKIAYCVSVLAIMLGLVGCNSENSVANPSEGRYNVYYLNDADTTIKPLVYSLESSTKEDIVKELLLKLSGAPEEKNLKSVFEEGIKINSISISEDQVTVDFSEGYGTLSTTKEVLVRAAVVRTLSQVEGVNFVSFKIEGENLTDAKGEPVGMMVKEMFIDNEGSQISDYVEETITLYFANETGDKLIPCTREVEHNTSVAIEKVLMEQLIAGPMDGQGQPTINPATKVVNVTVKDGTCYVNLDESFLVSIYPVTNDVVIYSIVNSLTSLSNINKVQLMVQGESKVSFREAVSLENSFSRQLDIIEEEGVHEDVN